MLYFEIIDYVINDLNKCILYWGVGAIVAGILGGVGIVMGILRGRNISTRNKFLVKLIEILSRPRLIFFTIFWLSMFFFFLKLEVISITLFFFGFLDVFFLFFLNFLLITNFLYKLLLFTCLFIIFYFSVKFILSSQLFSLLEMFCFLFLIKFFLYNLFKLFFFILLYICDFFVKVYYLLFFIFESAVSFFLLRIKFVFNYFYYLFFKLLPSLISFFFFIFRFFERFPSNMRKFFFYNFYSKIYFFYCFKILNFFFIKFHKLVWSTSFFVYFIGLFFITYFLAQPCLFPYLYIFFFYKFLFRSVFFFKRYFFLYILHVNLFKNWGILHVNFYYSILNLFFFSFWTFYFRISSTIFFTVLILMWILIKIFNYFISIVRSPFHARQLFDYIVINYLNYLFTFYHVLLMYMDEEAKLLEDNLCVQFFYKWWIFFNKKYWFYRSIICCEHWNYVRDIFVYYFRLIVEILRFFTRGFPYRFLIYSVNMQLFARRFNFFFIKGHHLIFFRYLFRVLLRFVFVRFYYTYFFFYNYYFYCFSLLLRPYIYFFLRVFKFKFLGFRLLGKLRKKKIFN